MKLRFRWTQSAVIGIAAAALFWASFAAAGQAPADQVKRTVDRIIKIVSDPALKGDTKAQERRGKLEETIRSRFDFAEMAKRSLGAQWRKRTPDEQKEFVRLFTDLLEGAYLDQIESYNGEKVRYLDERVDKDNADVKTKIVNNKGQELSVNYRLHNENDDWKVVDVVIENISLVNNYRSQFNRVLSRSSYAELIDSMKKKEKMAAPGAKS